MKKITTLLLLFCFQQIAAQQFSGNLESNSQYYLSESNFGIEAPQDAFRANNYFNLRMDHKQFSVGIQYEAYLPNGPLLGYSPSLNGNEIATYFAKYKNDLLEVTAGYFFEEFGNGLALRSWEERQLGLNNALKGIRVKSRVFSAIDLTALFAKQRVGFETSEGSIQALDLNYDKNSWNLGASLVSRYTPNTNPDPDYPSYVTIYSARLGYSGAKWSIDGEYLFKSQDIRIVQGQEVPGNYFTGNALQIDFNYAAKRWAFNTQFRRLENFGFYADRDAYLNQYNEQVINYTPALTKQQDYTLMNIYVYQAQPFLILEESKSGEIGGQIDFYYRFKKDSWLGKRKTKLAFNASYWTKLDAEYDVAANEYSSEYLGFGEKLYRDYSIEMRNRWSKSWSSIVTYLDQFYNKGAVEGGSAEVYARTIAIEATKRMSKGKSLKLDVQHLWTEEDLGNWAAAGAEFYFNRSFSIYVNDMYNYGEGDSGHFLNSGLTYTHKSSRVSLAYGRQRGGLICVGGVCRFVPENYGFSLNFNTSF